MDRSVPHEPPSVGPHDAREPRAPSPPPASGTSDAPEASRPPGTSAAPGASGPSGTPEASETSGLSGVSGTSDASGTSSTPDASTTSGGSRAAKRPTTSAGSSSPKTSWASWANHVVGPWGVRVGWLGLPFVSGPVLADGLADSSRPVQVVASLGLWGAWVVVLIAALVPRTLSLTVVRIAAPAACAAVIAAVVSGDSSTGWQVAALSWAVVTSALTLSPVTGQAFVDGSSYGDERRFPLRVPVAVLAGPLELAWAVVVAGLAVGPLLLAARQWLAGGVVLVAGLTAAWWGLRALHNLSRRWVVLVPGGMVLHDPLALADPVLFRRATIRRLGPAPADTRALDLTRGALGLALEVELVEPVPLTLAPAGPRRPSQTVETDRLLFTPTRPGVLLAATRARHLG